MVYHLQKMKENEHVELEGISPFNRFFFRSCYFHQLLACYMYFGVMPEMVIGNYLNACKQAGE